MESDVIYFREFPNCIKEGKHKDNGKFDLSLLPTQTLKEEFRSYIMYRGKIGNYSKLRFDRLNYNCIVKFLNNRINRNINSLSDRTE